MRSKEELAKEYINLIDRSEAGFGEECFIEGYNAAIEKVKEYLFNTEEHQDKNGKFYISEDYLKQTIKFLNEH